MPEGHVAAISGRKWQSRHFRPSVPTKAKRAVDEQGRAAVTECCPSEEGLRVGISSLLLGAPALPSFDSKREATAPRTGDVKLFALKRALREAIPSGQAREGARTGQSPRQASPSALNYQDLIPLVCASSVYERIGDHRCQCLFGTGSYCCILRRQIMPEPLGCAFNDVQDSSVYVFVHRVRGMNAQCLLRNVSRASYMRRARHVWQACPCATAFAAVITERKQIPRAFARWRRTCPPAGGGRLTLDNRLVQFHASKRMQQARS